MKTKILLSVLGLLLAGGIAWASVSHVSAQTTVRDTIIQKLAAKFGLKEADVQTVFDTQRTERQAAMQQRFEQNLTQAVADKKITESQKNAILAKHQELLKQQTQNRTEWLAWLKANNLENVDLGIGFGGGMGKGMGMGRGMHGW